MSVDQRNGKYRVRWREYPGGPQKTKHFERKRDADRHDAEMKVALARGTYLTADQLKVTLGQYINEHLGRRTWQARTVDIATRALNRVISRWGEDRPMSSIRRGDVEAYVVWLSSRLAASTVRTEMQHVRQMLQAAQVDGFLSGDPSAKIRLPPVPTKELVVPDRRLVEALMAAASPDFAVAIVLGAYAGLRAGEAQGLLVSDVDFLRRTVNVRRQFDGTSTVMRLAEPKTSASRRSVPVPEQVTTMLAAHIARFGPGPDGVLLHRDGEYLSDNQFNWQWRRAQKRAGLTSGSLRFHWLRHAFASSLISAGCSVKAVATAMGHENPTITLTTYASLWPGDDDKIRAAIERGLLGEGSSCHPSKAAVVEAPA